MPAYSFPTKRQISEGQPTRLPSEASSSSEKSANMASLHPSTFELSQRFGGVWGEHPEFPAQKWQEVVSQNATRLGYWEWVKAELESSLRAATAAVSLHAKGPAEVKINALLTVAEHQYGHLEPVARNCAALRRALATIPRDSNAIRIALICLATALDDQPRAHSLVDTIDALLGLPTPR